jgi:hypothetical protein
MIDTARNWFKENSTLIYFLVAQAFALGAAGLSVATYMVHLETRVSTLETRGSPHLEKIDARLTVLEAQTKTNKDSIERIVDVMTRKLNINP